jgi:hypothetical protein
MRKAHTWTPLGSLTTRIAARLTARREAEIQEGSAAEDRREPRMEGKSPAGPCETSRVVPGPVREEGAQSISECAAATPCAALGREEGAPETMGVSLGRRAAEAREGASCSANNVIQFVAVGATRPGWSHGRPAPSVPADLIGSALAAAVPRAARTFSYQRYSGVPLGGRRRVRTASDFSAAAFKCGR